MWKVKKSTLVSGLILAALMELFVLTILNISLLIHSQQIFLTLPLQIMLHIVTVVLVSLLFISVILIKQLMSLMENEAQYKAKLAYIGSIDELFTALKSQRHGFLNHVQAIYAMLKAEKYCDATKYLKTILKETINLNEIIVVDRPEVSALLMAKSSIAANRGIKFKISVETSLGEIPGEPHELNTVLGNIIDNAFDAVAENAPSEKEVSLEVRQTKESYIVRVENPGQIDPAMAEQLFTKGVTTKDSKHAGLGLYIVKNIVAKYNGSVKLNNIKDNKVLCMIQIP